MYKIGILEKDEAYLKRLVDFLSEHHSDSFDIHIINETDTKWDKIKIGNMDIQTAHFDAIFIGDNIEIEGEIPASAHGFITEDQENGKQYINKYQSLEKIYKHMFAICESNKNQSDIARKNGNLIESDIEEYGLKTETIKRNGETYRVYNIGESQIDMLAIKMLTSNHILGLGQIHYNNNKLELRITNMKTLYQMVQGDNTPEGKQELLKIFGNMVSTALSLEEYMLSADRLILDPKEIYIDKNEGEVIIPYIPIKSNNSKNIQQSLEELRSLCDILLEGLYKIDANIEEAYKKDKENITDQASMSDTSLEILQIGEDDSGNLDSVLLSSEAVKYVANEDVSNGLTLSDGDILEGYAGKQINSKADTINEKDIKSKDNFSEKIQEVNKADLGGQEFSVNDDNNNEDYGSTEAFSNLQNNAKESLKLKEDASARVPKRMPFIVRKRTGEKVMIDRNIFKMGKDESYVDYCIKDNPTVSRNHADIVRKADGFYLVDKNSLNHTFVDGEKLIANEYKKLNNGCLLQLADEVFEFVMI